MTPTPRDDAPPPPPAEPTGSPPANGGGAPEDRHSTNGKTGLVAWIVKDWPLKLFAMVLAFMIWVVVREQITTSLTVTDIPLEIEIDEGYVVLSRSTEKVSLLLQGPWGDVSPARAALLAPGGRVRLLLRSVTGEGATTTKANASDYTFPFEQAGVVASVTPPLNVEWARLAERMVPVASPPPFSIPPDANIEAVPAAVVLDVKQVRVRGPASLVEGLKSVSLDPIAVGPWWDTHPDLLTPMTWESGFEAWRGEVPAEAKMRASRVLSITPDRVTGRAKFLQTGSRALSHRLQHMTPAGAADAERYEYLIERSKDFDPRTETLQVGLKGDQRSLDFLERSPDEWTCFIEYPPPLDPSGQPWSNKEVPVHILIRKSGITASLDGSPKVLVSVKLR